MPICLVFRNILILVSYILLTSLSEWSIQQISFILRQVIYFS